MYKVCHIPVSASWPPTPPTRGVGGVGLAISSFLTSLLCLSLAASSFTASHAVAEEAFTSIKSYGGNFLATAPDATTAGWVAKVAEVTRERVFDLLGFVGSWRHPANIVLRARSCDTPEGEAELWTISVARGGVRIVNEDVYPNKRDDAVVLQVVSLCLDDMAGPVPPQNRPPERGAIPPWLSCGVAENLSRANIAVLRGFAREIVNTEKFLPLGNLFRAENLPSDEARRELFFKQSGSILDFLIHVKDGPSKLRQAITGLAADGDFTASLTSAFAADFVTVAHLEEKWKEFVIENADKAIDAPRMPLLETKQALDGILTVAIPTVDKDTLQEKVITTGFTGLFNHRNERVSRQIATAKAAEVFRLSLRAKAEYAPILEEYLLALTAIVNNERREFKRHFLLAEKLRKELEQSPDFKVEESQDADTVDQ